MKKENNIFCLHVCCAWAQVTQSEHFFFLNICPKNGSHRNNVTTVLQRRNGKWGKCRVKRIIFIFFPIKYVMILIRGGQHMIETVSNEELQHVFIEN